MVDRGTARKITMNISNVVSRVLFMTSGIRASDLELLGMFIDQPRRRAGQVLVISASASILPAMTAFMLTASPVALVLSYLCAGWFFSFLQVSPVKKQMEKERADLERVIPLMRMVLGFLRRALPPGRDATRIFTRSLAVFEHESRVGFFREFHVQVLLHGFGEHSLATLRTASTKFDAFLRACFQDQQAGTMSHDVNAFSEYRAFLKTLESRIVIIIAQGIFFPLIVLMVFMFNMISTVVLAVLVVAHALIIDQLSRVLLDREFNVFSTRPLLGAGANNVEDPVPFLLALGSNLQYNAVEVAFMKTCLQLLESHVLVARASLQEKNLWSLDFNRQLDWLSNESRSFVFQTVLSILMDLHEFSGDHFGQLVIEIAGELARQQELEVERDTIVKGEQFKVKVLAACFPFILSIIAALSPFFSIHQDPLEGFTMSGILVEIHDTIALIAFNMIVNYITVYYLLKIVFITPHHQFCLCSTAIFLGTFVTCFMILSSVVS